ncbi:hypothetical protein C6P46_006293 [Rhodotorula mucilaginosa]|uniref:Uncharacterized protein n=1 Tax=Rhodotorula mucilaginosa TaxID=5537 RepID=A0A9P6VWC3_RHOMI|nr:hypothetical protein C6P46_006293 [Rhodotorula mucilaginosa]
MLHRDPASRERYVENPHAPLRPPGVLSNRQRWEDFLRKPKEPSMTDYYNKRTPPKNPFDYFRYRGGRPRPDSDDKIDPFGTAFYLHPRKTSPSSSGSSHRSSIPCSRSRGSHRHSASRGGGPFNGDSPTLGYPDSSLVAHSPDTAHRHGGQDPAGSERRFSNGDSPTLGHPDYSILVPSPGSAYQHGRQDFADSKEEGSGANVPYDHRRSRHGASPTNLAAVHRPSNPETSAGMPRPDSGALDPFPAICRVRFNFPSQPRAKGSSEAEHGENSLRDFKFLTNT